MTNIVEPNEQFAVMQAVIVFASMIAAAGLVLIRSAFSRER